MISIIIPVYNVEKYLHFCLNSVLKQTYQDFEVICVDDASTDASLEILEYFAKKDSRIKIFKNDLNSGQGYSRNRGLEISKGKYIFFLDADDWLVFNALELLVNEAEKNNLDVLMFKYIVFYEKNKSFGMEPYYDMEFMNIFENKIFNHYDLDKTKFFRIPNGPCNKLYLKSFLDENNIRFPNKRLINEDNPFFCEILLSATKISLLNKYLYNRRRRENSTMTLNNSRLMDNLDIAQLILDIFIKEEELYKYYKKEVLNYIFVSVLNSKYNQINNKYKNVFFEEILKLYNHFYITYGLKEDILNNVNKKILKRFNQIE